MKKSSSKKRSRSRSISVSSSSGTSLSPSPAKSKKKSQKKTRRKKSTSSDRSSSDEEKEKCVKSVVKKPPSATRTSPAPTDMSSQADDGKSTWQKNSDLRIRKHFQEVFGVCYRLGPQPFFPFDISTPHFFCSKCKQVCF